MSVYPLLLPLIALLINSCAPYKIPTENLPEAGKIGKTISRKIELKHPLYRIIPRHRCQIEWFDLPHWITWALFGNDDDGIFGEEVKRGKKRGALRWFLRNPLHNFTFYAIGSAERHNSEIDLLRLTPTHLSLLKYRYPGKSTFAAKNESGIYLALHGGKPFVSLRIIHSKTRKSDLYFGWRHRGNFGIKCHLFGERK